MEEGFDFSSDSTGDAGKKGFQEMIYFWDRTAASPDLFIRDNPLTDKGIPYNFASLGELVDTRNGTPNDRYLGILGNGNISGWLQSYYVEGVYTMLNKNPQEGIEYTLSFWYRGIKQSTSSINKFKIGAYMNVQKPNSNDTGERGVYEFSINSNLEELTCAGDWTKVELNFVPTSSEFNYLIIEMIADDPASDVYVYIDDVTLTLKGINCEETPPSVQAPPSVKILKENSPSFLCKSKSYQFSGSAENGNPHWSHNGKGNLQNENTLNPVYFVNETDSGITTFILSAEGQSMTVKDSLQLSIIQSPKAIISIQELSELSTSELSSSVNLKGLINEGDNFLWKCDGEGAFTVTQTLNPKYFFSASDKKNVEIILLSFNGCDTAKNILKISKTTNNVKIFANAGNKLISICAGESVKLAGKSSSDCSVSWTHNGKGSLKYNKTLNPIYTSNINDNSLITFTLTATYSDKKTKATSTTTLEIKPRPVSSIVTKPEPINRKQDVTIKGDFTDGEKVIWESSGKGGLFNLSPTTVRYYPSSEDLSIVKIKMKVTSQCGASESIVSLIIKDEDKTMVSKRCQVTIKDFMGEFKDDNIELSWKTTNEFENKEFEVYRLKDENTYQKIGIVNSLKPLNGSGNYDFSDKNFDLSGNNTYRIFQKCINEDLKGKYSETITITNPEKLNMFEIKSVYPNPSESGPMKINIAMPASGEVTLSLFNLSGNLVTEEIFNAPAGESIVELDVDNLQLSRGTYLYNLKYNLKNIQGKYVRLSNRERSIKEVDNDTLKFFDFEEFSDTSIQKGTNTRKAIKITPVNKYTPPARK